jgi:cellobiose phosphorylase
MEVQNSTLTRKKQIYKIANSSGLTFSILENGTIKSIRNSNVRINLVEAGLLQKSFCNLYLRKRNKGGKISAVPLLGSAGPSEIKISDNIFQTKGCFDRVSYCCELVLSQNNNCWFWNIQLENTSDQTTVLDVIYVQDVGLSAVKGETNQAYVSQYVDFTSLVDDKYGNILCCRQNEHGPDCTPWLGLGAVSGIESFSTDGLSLFGKPYRQTGIPQFLTQSKLTGLRQKELAVVALQHKPFTLKPSQQKEIDFFAVYCKDHPEPASFSDLNIIDEQVRAFSGKIEFNGVESVEPVRDLFSQSPFFQAENLTEKQINKLFPGKRFSEEFYEDKLLSFFRQDGKHIVLKDKELLVCRPHANIVRTGSGLIPDERIMSCTGYMYGVFISQLTQGNVDFNRFLSGSYDSLNFNRSSGQRIFIKRGDKYCQLGLPSAFEMSYNSCRWIYKNDKSLFELIITASQEIPQISLELNVIEGEPVQLFISNNLTEENKWQHGYIKDTRFEIKSIDFYPYCDTQ